MDEGGGGLRGRVGWHASIKRQGQLRGRRVQNFPPPTGCSINIIFRNLLQLLPPPLPGSTATERYVYWYIICWPNFDDQLLPRGKGKILNILRKIRKLFLEHPVLHLQSLSSPNNSPTHFSLYPLYFLLPHPRLLHPPLLPPHPLMPSPKLPNSPF